MHRNYGHTQTISVFPHKHTHSAADKRKKERKKKTTTLMTSGFQLRWICYDYHGPIIVIPWNSRTIYLKHKKSTTFSLCHKRNECDSIICE